MQVREIIEYERKRARQGVMDFFFALKASKGTPTLKDLIKLARRVGQLNYVTWGNAPDGYFSDIDQAAYEIGEFCRRWGRINVTQTKEKYGTARVYTHFSVYSLQSLIYPGYVYTQKPEWLMRLPIPAWIGKLIFPYQRFIYRLAYKRALKKYPAIREEILCGADYNEFLRGL